MKRIFPDEAIKSLGSSADAIAKKLKKLKIKGEIGSQDSCPISIYLIKVGFTDPIVDHNQVECELSGNGYDFTFAIDTPKAIGVFINRFDAGKYPELKR